MSERSTLTKKERKRERVRERGRQKEREKERKRERERGRKKEREKERKRERDNLILLRRAAVTVQSCELVIGSCYVLSTLMLADLYRLS
jgi:hypothetical protein